MLICGFCGGQLSIDVVFDQAHTEHAVLRYDERIYIPIYRVHQSLSAASQSEQAYTAYEDNMRTQIRQRYEVLLANMESQSNRPILDIGEKEMGTNVQLYTPGNLTRMYCNPTITNQEIF